MDVDKLSMCMSPYVVVNYLSKLETSKVGTKKPKKFQIWRDPPYVSEDICHQDQHNPIRGGKLLVQVRKSKVGTKKPQKIKYGAILHM